jgi:hypothetical protein
MQHAAHFADDLPGTLFRNPERPRRVLDRRRTAVVHSNRVMRHKFIINSPAKQNRAAPAESKAATREPHECRSKHPKYLVRGYSHIRILSPAHPSHLG